MLRSRRNKKLTKAQRNSIQSGSKYLLCKECGITEIKTNYDTHAVTCGICVMQKLLPLIDVPTASNKPKGWHFRKYFEFEGKVYSKGIEVTDNSTIEKLKAEASSKLPYKKNSKRK